MIETKYVREVREQIQQDLTGYLDGIQSVLPEGSENVIEGVCEIVVKNFAKFAIWDPDTYDEYGVNTKNSFNTQTFDK